MLAWNSSPMQDVDTLLAELRAAGGVDSEGHFSLDAGAAREKLARFRLPHPAMWPLPFVSVAMWANASRLTFSERAGTWTVEWDTPTAVDEIPALLASATATAALDALRTALEMVVVLRPERVTITSGDRMIVLRGNDAGPAQGVRRPRDFGAANVHLNKGTRIVIEPGDLWRRLRGFIFESVDQVDEAHVLRSAAQHAALDVLINDRLVTSPIDLSDSLVARVVEPEHPLPASGLRFIPPQDVEHVDGSAPLRALLWVPVRPQTEPSFTLVVGGLSFEVDPATLGMRRIACVVAAPHIEKDLSQSKLLLDEAFDTVVEDVARHARAMLTTLARHALDKRDGLLLVDLWQGVGEDVLSTLDPHIVWMRIARVGDEIVRRGQYDVAAEVVCRLASLNGEVEGTVPDSERVAGEVAESLIRVMVARDGPVDTRPLERAIGALGRIRASLAVSEPERASSAQARQRRAERRLLALRALKGRVEEAWIEDADDLSVDNVLGLCERLKGRLEEAERRHVTGLERRGNPTGETPAQTMLYLAEIARTQNRLRQAAERYEQGLSRLDDLSPSVRIPLLEGWAEALHADGNHRRAVRTLEMAIDLRLTARPNDEHDLTLCAVMWRHFSVDAGQVFREPTSLGRWLHRFVVRTGIEAPSRNEALSFRPLDPSAMDEALRTSQSLPFAALKLCEDMVAQLTASEGVAADGLERVLTLAAYVHRRVGQRTNLREADICMARRHLVALLR